MNIYYYWSRGPEQLLRNIVLFHTSYMRPMGGVYYSLLYHFFGLNPFPYHVVTTCLLLVNTFLAYRFAVLLTGSALAGGFCSFLVAYHSEMAQLVYMPSFIYDVLCFTFYFLAFHYYLSIRMRGERLRARQIAAFLLLYLGALESKEMAVTLPVLVLLYEVLWHAPGRRSLRSAAVAGAVTLLYVAGKAYGPESLIRMEAYRPVFTLDRYLESTTSFFNTLFYQPTEHGFFGPGRVLAVLLLLLGIAWRAGQKHLLLMWFFILITPLPVTFVPGRGAACLYLPLAGWAVFLGSLLASLLRRIPAVGTRTVAALGVVALQWALSSWGAARMLSWMQDEGKRTASVLEQIRSLQPAVKPGARLYVLDDVFDGFDTKYLFELTYRDRSVDVWLAPHGKLTPAEVQRMDYIFTFENGALKRLKGSTTWVSR